MIVNVLRFSFRNDVTEDEKAEVLATMRRTASTGSVAFAAVGQDLGDPAEGFTHAYLAAIPDLDALEQYMHDPVHVKGDDVILGRLARLSAVRLSDDLDPGLHQAIFAMHARKAAMYPDWGREVEALLTA
ncbi:stress protein [Parafrankia soli]|uniref:Stress protein n=1 Tax=Parafrankia soli TaxID=2599596 RepID=A0A1S1R862_9ACTN|nr:Dabb family protein [Parafrankia soli]OHV42106.1 stress protein [Parafrankia soli]